MIQRPSSKSDLVNMIITQNGRFEPKKSGILTMLHNKFFLQLPQPLEIVF